MRIFVIALFLLFQVTGIHAQQLYSMNSTWDDDLRQWNVSLDEGEIEGEIRMTWRMNGDVSDWNFRIGETSGTIRRKWTNNPNVWELRSGSTIVTVSTVYTGDFYQFRITDGEKHLKVERTYRNTDIVEWKATSGLEDTFFWYNEYNYDLRDWIIEDYLVGYSLEMKLAAVFVTILHSLN